jgi:hypothetical protein
MPLIPEDGTGLPDANSLGTVAGFKAYHDERGTLYSTLAPDDATIEAALIRATDYVETRWGRLFRGEVLSSAQALSWPRKHVYDRGGELVEGVPAKIGKGLYELALRALSQSLYLEPTVEETGQALLSKSEKVGPIETSVTYQQGGAVQTIRPYPLADAYFREFAGLLGGVVR